MKFFKGEESRVEKDIIAENDSFRGKIESHSTVEISGQFIGETLNAEKVVIAKNGSVKSDLFAKFIILEGVLIGNVKNADRMILISNGKLLGNIEAKELIISEGVMLEGNFKIMPNTQANLEQVIHQNFAQPNLPENQSESTSP